MADGEEQVDLKFRIYDGTDIGHGTYISSTAISVLKQRLVHQWPQGYYPSLCVCVCVFFFFWEAITYIVDRYHKSSIYSMFLVSILVLSCLG